jgi:hypothetical protein
MEKEKILSTITEQLGTTGLSAKTIGDYVDANLPAEGVEPDDAYFSKHTTFLKSLSGNFNHDVAAQVDTFKKNYKPEPAPQPTVVTPTNPQGDDTELQGLKKELAELKTMLSEKQSQEKQSAIYKEVREKMLEKHADDTYVLDKTLQGVTFDAKKSTDEIVKEQLERYDKELTACRGNGAKPRITTNNPGKTSSAVDMFFARKKAREGWGQEK